MSDLFSFLMEDDYDERLVANTQRDDFIVDTARISDQEQGNFETGIESPFYNDNKWVIVGIYDTKENAQKGHNAWVKTMEDRPSYLVDVSDIPLTQMIDEIAKGEPWRVYERQVK